MVERKAFFAKLKHQYHVSQWGEHDGSAQSQKEWRLFLELSFISIDGQTLILSKVVERIVFLAKPKYQYYVSYWGKIRL